jgi:hypothetical protein
LRWAIIASVALANHGIGEARLGLVGAFERGGQQRLERFDVVREGRCARVHDGHGNTDRSGVKAKNAPEGEKVAGLSGALRTPRILRVTPVDPLRQRFSSASMQKSASIVIDTGA